MGDRTIILVDETEYDGLVGRGENEIWLFVEAEDLDQAIRDFADPEKIATVTFNWRGELLTYEGYTELVALLRDVPHMGAVGFKFRKPAVSTPRRNAQR